MKKKTLVIGVSKNPNRYANRAMQALRQNGFESVAIGKQEATVDDIDIKTEIPTSTYIDTVTLYINPNLQEAYKDFILDLNPNRVIFNPGTEHSEFKTLLEESGIKTLNACTLVLLATNQY
jgi:predicted CoA-binding protein